MFIDIWGWVWTLELRRTWKSGRLFEKKQQHRICQENDACPSVFQLLQCFSIQTPFAIHFSPFLCGSLQLECWPSRLIPPDNEPSITTGCGNHPQGRALTDSQDVRCMAAAGRPRHIGPYIHILQKGKSTGVNMVSSWRNMENIYSFQLFYSLRVVSKTEQRDAFRVCSVHAWLDESIRTSFPSVYKWSKSCMFSFLLTLFVVVKCWVIVINLRGIAGRKKVLTSLGVNIFYTFADII